MHLDNLDKHRVAGAAASFQPELATVKQCLGRSDKAISINQRLPDVKVQTQ